MSRAIAALLRPLSSRVASPATLLRWAPITGSARRCFSSDSSDPPSDAGFNNSEAHGDGAFDPAAVAPDAGLAQAQSVAADFEQAAAHADGGFEQNAPGEEFAQTAESGTPFYRGFGDEMVYGKLSQLGRSALKSDIVNYLDDCGLSPNDIKFEYNRNYAPIGTALVQFSSQHAFEVALRQIIRKGRLFRLEKCDRSDWDKKPSWDGKALLLQGVPRNALPDDIDRFLSGAKYDPSFQFVQRPDNPDKCALVRFQTAADAMNAYIVRNRRFILNNPITLRVLH